MPPPERRCERLLAAAAAFTRTARGNDVHDTNSPLAAEVSRLVRSEGVASAARRAATCADAAGAAAPRAFAAELSALRAVATGLARDICEAAEFGLAASAVDVPKAPPGAPDEEEAPAAGEAKYWYDAARNEIRLL